jgi:hypothetical protein
MTTADASALAALVLLSACAGASSAPRSAAGALELGPIEPEFEVALRRRLAVLRSEQCSEPSREPILDATSPAGWRYRGYCDGRVVQRRPRAPEPGEVELIDTSPSELEFEGEFANRLVAVSSSPACAQAPPHAVLEAATRRARFLGFCDGRIVQQLASGGLVISSTGVELPAEFIPGWETRLFSVGGLAVMIEVPTDARVRVRSARGDAVRLAGKHFDLRIEPLDGREAVGPPAPPSRCTVVESGPRHVICRQGPGHRVVARAQIGSRVFQIESDPRLRASLRQAQEMLLAVQLMHRVGRGSR